jgi:hypothetical protein
MARRAICQSESRRIQRGFESSLTRAFEFPIESRKALRGRLEVIDEFTEPGARDERLNFELYGTHSRNAESAGEGQLRDDEQGAAGFLFGADKRLTATLRWRSGDLAGLRGALERWTSENGFEAVTFDESFDREPG